MRGRGGRSIGGLAVLAIVGCLALPALAQDAPEQEPAPVRASESVVVTATRTEQPASDAPPSLVVLTPQDLAASAAPTLDDTLRQVPGFNLFRRTGSRVANPTAQGVSLRGLGPSGASRALVLADGLPLNDPFGGWVYWGRVPLESVERIEVLRGGASDLYGSAALGGVIQILTRPIGRPDLSLEAGFGNQATAQGSLSAGGRRGDWGTRVSAAGLTTHGYVLVDEAERGPIDTPAGARYATVDVTLDRSFAGGRAFVRGGRFGESRRNGTPLQTNSTDIDHVAVGVDRSGDRLGNLSARLSASAQTYDQTFTAIDAERSSEALTRSQHVPAQDIGLSLQWSRPLAAQHVLVAGLLAREVRGASDELAFVAGVPSSAVGAGGREGTLSLFAEDLFRVSARVRVSASARVDRWSRYRALSTTTPLGRPGAPTVQEFPDHAESSFDPRASIAFKASERLELTAAAYRSFRGPTLNELYRSFRVGDVVTLANDTLRAERLHGGELGARWRVGTATLSASGFWTETRDPVANVTLGTAPRLITRQRQNLGRTRARGFELDAQARFAGSWHVAGGYAFTDGTVLHFPPAPELEGNLLPQLPRHQASLRLRFEGKRFTGSVSLRAVGLQYEDDRNELELAGFAVCDAAGAWRVSRWLEAFAAFENVFDRRYAVGLTPVATIGPPFLVHTGLRLRLGAARP